MQHRTSLLAAAIVAGLCCTPWPSQAQSTTPPASGTDTKPASNQTRAEAKNAKDLAAVTVTGIRGSMAKSLDTKRDADAIVDAITAEDIGKFPSTNVAEAMAQIPGVTIDRRFGQGERVSIDGTDPSLNLTFLDGHPVAQTPWLVGEQPNRGFDYTLLAPEVLGRLEIYKSPEARLPEGSIGGTVIMHTREPLDLKANTVTGTVGFNYGDQADKARPNASVLYSWKNTQSTLGALVSVSHYEEQTDRQGTEIFNYQSMNDASQVSPLVTGLLANGQVAGSDLMPDSLNAAWFQQHRKRDTVTGTVQYKPTDRLEFTASALYVRENFSNFEQSLYFQGPEQNLDALTTPANHGVVQGGHVCGAAAGCSPTIYLDSFARKSVVTTKGLDLKGSYRGDGWELTGQTGASKASNTLQEYYLGFLYGGSYNWDIKHGIHFDDPSAARDPTNWISPSGSDSLLRNPLSSRDFYGQLDFSKDFDGAVNQVLIGARYTRHNEGSDYRSYAQGITNGSLADVGGISYTDFLTSSHFSGFSADQRRHVQTTDGAELAWIDHSPIDWTAVSPANYINGTWSVRQEAEALYAQGNFNVDSFRGNFGVRYVHTKIDGNYIQAVGVPVYPVPDAWRRTSQATYNDWLPAFNLAYDTQHDVVLRLSAAKVISWAPYNQLVPNTFLNDDILNGTGGNGGLQPYKSYNFNASAEWYFSSQSVLAASVFYKHVLNYIDQVAKTERLYNSFNDSDHANFVQKYVNGQLGNCDVSGYCDYTVIRPYNAGAGKIRGFTLNYQQPFGDTGFGLSANYTYTHARNSTGQALPYSSDNAINLSPYYEKGPLSARLIYGWRSKYLAGGFIAGAAPATVDAYTELDASLGWTFNPNISVTLDAMNLLDEKYFQYQDTKREPLNTYTTGRRYMMNLHFKF
ncbi:TonB-dependent receptor [Dyella sp. OK004]|uniref:TonB-dependent receptor n=1 Tax=Dyella sp. OK004 TaxID=1855292 RepID=UPI0008EBF0F2|nr:TonB-dependent receptor [Dyella sp. OK004]SFR86302.1 TonB-dependent receptor [Dyella sp. OK004]